MLKIRQLLYPISFIYEGVLGFRHLLYDRGILSTFTPDQKTIVVGNLALGGTGKTPHIDYLTSLTDPKKTAILSRGYKRSTKGTIEVLSSHTAEMVGDEPLQLKRNHPGITVLVDENRKRGLLYLKERYPEINLVLLDDAFQHRKVKGGLNLILTTWDRPFVDDHLIPSGRLRDLKKRARAADMIVVSKVPDNVVDREKEDLRKRLESYSKRVVFSALRYGGFYSLLNRKVENLPKGKKAILVTGIANPAPLIEKVAGQFELIKHFQYPDHYTYNEKDIVKLSNFIDTFANDKPAIITTEKDAVKIERVPNFERLGDSTFVFWKIEVDFGSDKEVFEKNIKRYLN